MVGLAGTKLFEKSIEPGKWNSLSPAWLFCRSASHSRDADAMSLFRPLHRNVAGAALILAIVAILGGCGGSSGSSANSGSSSSTTTTGSQPAVAITTSSLPSGQVNTAYSATLSASGGTSPYEWSIASGTLPAGLSLSAASGTISGTPSTAISGDVVTFMVTDSSHPALTVTAKLTLTISAAASGLVITTTSLPTGRVNKAYAAALAATGGTTPYTWSLVSGTLPSGLSISASSGAITGIPSVAVTNAAFTFQVSDSSHSPQTATATLALTISSVAFAISTSSLPAGQVNTNYSVTLAARGGTKPYSWALTSGTLPAGLSFDPPSGMIAGTPTTVGSGIALSFTVTDSSSPALTATANLTLTINPVTLAITTASLPSGQVNAAYSAALSASGGTSPYAWSLISGNLPTGITLNPSTGALSGLPTAAVSNTPLTFQVADSGTPAQSKSIDLTLTIAGASNITVSVSPQRSALTVGQELSLTATTTNDTAGVNWTATGGTLSTATSLTTVPVTYTAAASPGAYTITATSITDPSQSSSTQIYVTDLAGVFTYHNDLSRDGTNGQEYGLSASTINNSSFGKLFSCGVDGAIYAQPLWIANLTVNGAPHNVILVATEHDSLYAFDADDSSCQQLWSVSLIDTAHGGTGNETAVPWNFVGTGQGDFQPELGVTGTPVIDPTTNTLYVVSFSVDQSGPAFYQRLHAIDITTGNEKFSGPASIDSSITFPGTGDGGSLDAFNPQQENQRAGLALVNGTVYVAWGSHEDAAPYYGWLVGFDASTLAVRSVLNVTPNVQYGGIWMGGGAPSADNNSNLYVITSNAAFDVTDSGAPNNDYGDSFLQLSPGLNISTYFSPSDQAQDAANDEDFGAGGTAVVLNLPSGAVRHMVIGGGKDGTVYALNGDNMGGSGDSNAWQNFNLGFSMFATGAFWNNNLYIAGANGPLTAFVFSPGANLFNPSASSVSPSTFGFPGATPSISATGTNNGVVWALDNGSYCTSQSLSCGPTVLHAYDATNLANELWNSTQVPTDTPGNAVKFTVPTVANGKVYVGTRGDNAGDDDTSTSTPGELDVFGLQPN